MRIRKNANLSSFMFSHASGPEVLQTHVCQLNQSPWDVISFSQEPYPSSLHQFEGEDSFNGNGSLGDSIGAVGSVSSMLEDAEEKAAMKAGVDNMVIDDNYGMEGSPIKKRVFHDEEMKIENEFKFKKGEKTHCCNKTDGKGWHCKNEPKEGYSMCDHHLTLLKSYGNNNNAVSLGLTGPTSSKKPIKAINGARRGRGRAGKRGSSSSSNPIEFYYYSGFGPRWGKRRGNTREDSKNEDKDAETGTAIIATAAATPQNTTPSSSSSPIDYNEEFDYVDEDDDDDDNENADSRKKRMRKPVKARSLKSLM